MEKPKKIITNPLKDLVLSQLPDISTISDFCWRGNLENPRLMVVTESPSRTEIQTGIAFVSRAARFLELVLSEKGLRVGDFFNVFDRSHNSDIQWLREHVKPGDVFWYHFNLNPLWDEKDKLISPDLPQTFSNAAMFHELICLLQPKHLLLLGNGVVKPILGRNSASSAAGATLDYQVPTILRDAYNAGAGDSVTSNWLTKICNSPVPEMVVSTDMHPAGVMENDRKIVVWSEHLGKIVENLGVKIQVVQAEVEWFKEHDYDRACNFLQEWIDDPTLEELSYDWETTSLAPCTHRDSITLSFGCARDSLHGFCIPTWHPESKGVWSTEKITHLCKLIGILLRKPRKVTLGHNLLFDNLVSRCDPYLNLGRKHLPGVRQETMYLAYVNDEVGPQGLKELCNLYTDLHCYDDTLELYKTEHKIKGEYARIPLGILAPYNAYDAIANFRVRNALVAKLKADKRGPFLDIAFKLMWLQGQALEELAFNGQYIDREILFREGKNHEKKLHDAMMKLMQAQDMRDFIALRRTKKAFDISFEMMHKPVVLTRFYCKKHPGTDSTQMRRRMSRFTKPLKEGLAEIKDGEFEFLNHTPFDDAQFFTDLLLEVFQEQYEILDPEKDDLEKWKPWLKDEDYQADEEELIYYAANAGTGYKPNFNTHGGGEMGDFFFDHLKLPVNYRSEKTDAPSLSKEARPQLIGLHPTMEDFFSYKDTVKEYGSYFKPLIRGFRLLDAGQESTEIDPSGRSHLEIEIGRVVTGRTRAQRIQTFPRDGKVKDMYSSRFLPDGLVVQADMSQAELRVMASLSNEKKMIEAYLNGEDLHLRTSILLFGDRFLSADPKTKKKFRAVAKRINFGMAYGSGPEGLVTTCKKEGAELLLAGGYDRDVVYDETAAKMGLDWHNPYDYGRIEEQIDLIREAIAKDILNKFYAAYPDLTKWIHGVHEFLQKNGHYYSPFGRIRRLPGISSDNVGEQNEAKRQAQNFPIQSAASDIALVALAAIHADFEKRDMSTLGFAAVHDSLLFDAPYSEAAEVAEILEYRLTNVKDNFKELLPDFSIDWIKVPLATDVECGPSWGESYPYDIKEKTMKVVAADVEKDIAELWIPLSDFWKWKNQ